MTIQHLRDDFATLDRKIPNLHKRNDLRFKRMVTDAYSSRRSSASTRFHFDYMHSEAADHPLHASLLVHVFVSGCVGKDPLEAGVPTSQNPNRLLDIKGCIAQQGSEWGRKRAVYAAVSE